MHTPQVQLQQSTADRHRRPTWGTTLCRSSHNLCVAQSVLQRASALDMGKGRWRASDHEGVRCHVLFHSIEIPQKPGVGRQSINEPGSRQLFAHFHKAGERNKAQTTTITNHSKGWHVLGAGLTAWKSRQQEYGESEHSRADAQTHTHAHTHSHTHTLTHTHTHTRTCMRTHACTHICTCTLTVSQH